LRISQDGQETLLQLPRYLDFLQLGGRVDGAAIRVDECDTRAASLDVPLEQFARRFGEAPVEIVTEEVGDLPTLDGGRARRYWFRHRRTL